jgi:AcrR family transcriptional regulator
MTRDGAATGRTATVSGESKPGRIESGFDDGTERTEARGNAVPSVTSPSARSAEAVAPRGPGRPRDARCDHAILDATLELAGAVGLGGLTMDAVAARAGVSKATIYRRWSSKEALVLDAWMACYPLEAVPDTGSLTGDLIAHSRQFRDAVSEGVYGRVLPQMLAAARVNEDLAEVFRRLVADRRARVRVALERAVERGELSSGVDLELVQDLLIGPLFYRTVVSGEASTDEMIAEVVAIVVAGVVRMGGAAG